MIEDPATISLQLDSRPESVALVRGTIAGISERLPLGSELLDDLKTAVSEACNNVVMHAYDEGRGPLFVHLTVGPVGVEVIVRDNGRGIQQVVAAEDRMGVGLAVISALATRAEFLTVPTGGTEVRMAFREGETEAPSAEQPVSATPERAGPEGLAGDVVVTLSPVSLMGAVLGRLARAVAAGAKFSLDRFSDVYLVTDAVAALAEDTAAADHSSFALSSAERRLELTVGPLRSGSGARLQQDGSAEPTSPVAVLVDEISVTPAGELELVRLVMRDRSRDGDEADPPG